jgi:hypothetical protein
MMNTILNRNISPEKQLDFERDRLVNLINSKIRRNEMSCAQDLAVELFKTEVEFTLLRKTKKLNRYNNLCLNTIFFLICLLVLSIACTVLNIKPLFFFMVNAIMILIICSAFIFNAFLVRQFEQGIRKIVDAYEILQQSFTEKLLNSLKNPSYPVLSRNLFTLEVIK